MRSASLVAVVASLLCAPIASAQPVVLGDLELSGLWTRATPPRAPTAGGYLTITNRGSTADRLVAVASPDAALGELHEMKVTDGIMTMRPLDHGIEIPPGDTVVLAPGGHHIMFVDLRKPFVTGTGVPVALTFERAGTIETILEVQGVGAGAPPDGDHGGHAK